MSLILPPHPRLPPTVLHQPLAALHSLHAHIRLAPRPAQSQRLPGGGGDPSGLQRPGQPTGGAHGADAKGTEKTGLFSSTMPQIY